MLVNNTEERHDGGSSTIINVVRENNIYTTTPLMKIVTEINRFSLKRVGIKLSI